MAKPTRTTNRIHFSDLHDRRFEDLSMQIVYRLHKWEKIDHDGRAGSDDGVDIRAIERLPDGSSRDWFVQCRLYKKVATAELKKAVNDALAKAERSPEVLLIIVGCDVSRKARCSYEEYAIKKGVIKPLLWQASNLETKLYTDHHDLLFAFFGISLAQRERSRESKVKRNLAMKRRLSRILKEDDKGRKIIIRSIDDDVYPDIDDTPEGQISSWFRIEFNNFYHNGIQVILDVNYSIVEQGENPWWEPRWSVFNPHNEHINYIGEKGRDGEYVYNFYDYIDKNKYIVCKVFCLGRIPYRNVIECDEYGDGYYPSPHLYCNFADQGTPYESIVYEIIDGALPKGLVLEPSLNFPFKER
jgi:hypothetical protein